MTEILLVLSAMAISALGAIYGVAYAISKWWKSRLSRVVAEVNRGNGTAFAVGPTTALCSWTGIALLFDQKNRKLMLYLRGRHSLHDYSYIRNWQLKWTERIDSGGSIHFREVRIVFEMNDLHRPLQEIPVISKLMGDEWNHRLTLLLGG